MYESGKEFVNPLYIKQAGHYDIITVNISVYLGYQYLNKISVISAPEPNINEIKIQSQALPAFYLSVKGGGEIYKKKLIKYFNTTI